MNNDDCFISDKQDDVFDISNKMYKDLDGEQLKKMNISTKFLYNVSLSYSCSAKHTVLRNTKKDSLAQNQDNMFMWSDMSNPQAHGAWISFPPPPFLYYPPFFKIFI